MKFHKLDSTMATQIENTDMFLHSDGNIVIPITTLEKRFSIKFDNLPIADNDYYDDFSGSIKLIEDEKYLTKRGVALLVKLYPKNIDQEICTNLINAMLDAAYIAESESLENDVNEIYQQKNKNFINEIKEKLNNIIKEKVRIIDTTLHSDLSS